MIGSLIGGVVTSIANSAIGKIADAFTAYQNKQISLAELRARVDQAVLTSATEIEKAHAESVSKTYESFQVTMRQSPLVQTMWAWIVATQLVVLLWHQVGIPFYVKLTGESFPSSGSTVEWAYALIGFMFGAGALLLRTGPGAGVLDKLKGAIGR